MKPHSLLLSAAFSLLAAALAPACAAQIALDDRPCPCAEGWTCCATSNVCVGPGGSCQDTKGGLACLGDRCPDGSVGLGSLSGNNPTELAKAQSARCLVAAGDHVYWQNADGLVAGALRGGGSFEVSHFRTPLAENPRCGIAVDGDTLYTTSYSLGKIVELSLRSNGEWVIGATSSFFGALTTPSSLALTANGVVVTELEAGRVTYVPRTRAAAVVLAKDLVRPDDVRVLVSAEGTFAYFVERGTSGEKNGAIKRVAIQDGGPAEGAVVETLATGLDAPRGIEAVDGRLYFTTGRELVSIPVTGGASKVVVSDLVVGGAPFTTDPTFVYYAGGGGIAKARLEDGHRATLYPRSGIPLAIAADDGRIFWADGASVWSATK